MDQNALTLFDDFERTNNKRADHDSSNFRFLNNSAWKSSKYIRELVTAWSTTFPVDKDFCKRFRSKKNKEHWSAFFELVMSQLFQKHNLSVTFQQLAVSKSMRRPDFTLSSGNDKKFFAECTLSPSPHENEGIEKLQQQITDILEAVPSPKYWIDIHFMRSSTQTLPKKHISQFIEKMIAEGQPKLTTISNHRRWSLKESGWHIDFSLYPKSMPTQRTLIGVSNGTFELVDSQRPLRGALNSKRASN